MNYILPAVMTLLGAAASIFLKRAAFSCSAAALLRNKNLYGGGALYLASAVLNIVVLQTLPYSVVLPLTSLTYVWTLVLARMVLKESLSVRKIAGVTAILVGVGIICC